jgi:hypothetical protein
MLDIHDFAFLVLFPSSDELESMSSEAATIDMAFSLAVHLRLPSDHLLTIFDRRLTEKACNSLTQ